MKANYRKGFTLIEVAIALGIAGTAMVWTYLLISNGIKMQSQSIHLNNAIILAKIKMAQIDSSVKLQSDSSKGEIPGYRGYRFEIIIKEEEMDLLKMSKEKPSTKNKPPSDLLGNSSDKGLQELMKKRGKSSNESQTGGIIQVFHITVKIFYPSGFGEEMYSVETFKSAKN